MSYAQHFATRATPQSEPIPGSQQVQNSAGGYAYAIDDWARLDRFLILGNEGGTYYATEKKLTIENAQCVIRCADQDPVRAVNRIVEISDAGRAPKNDAAIFALAILAGHAKAKPFALLALPKVCRIGTHLFQFAEAVQNFRGWGRGLKRAVANWYTKQDPKALAYQVTKYQQRNGWSNRDLLRLSKPKGVEGPLNNILRWAVGKVKEEELLGIEPLLPIIAFEHAKKATDKNEVARIVREYKLPRECVPTQFLNEAVVWEALLESMPMTAMIRNLGKMTSIGLLAPLSQAVGKVLAEFTNVDRLRKSRLHPVAILLALKTYAQGHGDKGKLKWTPVPQIIDALDGAFYQAFGNVEPTGKRWMLACDVSGSMGCGTVAGTSLTPREGVGALALVTAKTEPNYFITGFSNKMVPINLSRHSRLDGVCRTMADIPMGGTDCALPMLYALENKLQVDVFTVLTDNETWFGTIHPSQALVKYREKTGINAKMIVVGMTATMFSIANPNDAGMMDVVGFDTATPQLMAEFAK